MYSGNRVRVTRGRLTGRRILLSRAPKSVGILTAISKRKQSIGRLLSIRSAISPTRHSHDGLSEANRFSYNAVDRHLEIRANQPAIFFHSSELGTEKVITYRQLHHEVTRFAAVLKEDYIAIERLKSVVAESKLQELRNKVSNLAYAIWSGRVQEGGGSCFGDASSDWFTARNELGIPPDLLLKLVSLTRRHASLQLALEELTCANFIF
jgi:hypothetical protein